MVVFAEFTPLAISLELPSGETLDNELPPKRRSSALLLPLGCQKSFFHNTDLHRERVFRLVVTRQSVAATQHLNFTISFHSCLTFLSLGTVAPSGGKLPRFDAVAAGRESKCSFDDYKRSCNWWNVVTNHTAVAPINVVGSAACVVHGVTSIPRGEKMFAVLEPKHGGGGGGGGRRTTVSSLISPLFRTRTDHLSLSFYYHQPCSGNSSISVYLTPQYYDAERLVATRAPSEQVTGQTKRFTRVDMELAIPEEYEEFHVSSVAKFFSVTENYSE